MHKLPDRFEQLPRRLDLWKMPGFLEQLEPGAWNSCGKRAAVVGVGDAISVAPNNERPPGHGPQPAREARIIHRGAGVHGEGRAIAGHRLERLRRQRCRGDPESVGGVVAVLRDLPRSEGEEVDNGVAWDLNADRVDEDETALPACFRAAPSRPRSIRRWSCRRP